MAGLYVTHTCLNDACGKGYIDLDRSNAKSFPPKRYCPDCVASGIGVNTKNPENYFRGKALALSKQLATLDPNTLYKKVLTKALNFFGKKQIAGNTNLKDLCIFLSSELGIPKCKSIYMLFAYALLKMEDKE